LLEVSEQCMAIEPILEGRTESAESNDRLQRALPMLSVCKHSPLLASHTLTVLSYDADASLLESCEKATDQMCAGAARVEYES
jgi:hypothetical protein